MSSRISHDDDKLDFAKIEKEVHNAVVDEEKYWRENDAKIRAVEQRVPTYDDFREMVLGAHLRPLDKGDRISDMGRFTQVWNQFTFGQTTDRSNQETKTNQDLDKNGMCMPQSGQHFSRTWKHLGSNKDDQKNYLLIVGPERLTALFKTEVTNGLLGEFFDCLQSIKASEASVVMDLLEVFANTPRFSLSLAFLSKSEKACGAAVFQRLKEFDVQDSERLMELEKKYKLN